MNFYLLNPLPHFSPSIRTLTKSIGYEAYVDRGLFLVPSNHHRHSSTYFLNRDGKLLITKRSFENAKKNRSSNR